MAGALTLASLMLGLFARGEDSILVGLSPALPVVALFFGVIYILADTLLMYQVHKGTGLTREESHRFAVSMKFGLGYAEWRKAVRRKRQSSVAAVEQDAQE